LQTPRKSKPLLEVMASASVLEIALKEVEMEEEPFAHGGFGEVFRAKWRHKNVVVKTIRTYSEEEKQEVMGEANLTFLLNHPNVIELFGVTQVRRSLIGIVMEEAEHRSLDRWIGKIDSEQLTKIALGIVVGLEYVHSQNVIHRDIKPQNILMFGPKDGMIPKLADFGSAKIIERVTVQSRVGQDHYMAPEVRMSLKYGHTADIFSLAVMLLEMFNEQLITVAPEEVKRFVFSLGRPGRKIAIPKSCNVPAYLRNVIERGFNENPERRPAISEYQAVLAGSFCYVLSEVLL